jgi:uncharacterized membrane protein
MAVVVLLVFGFWVILARGIFAIFIGQGVLGASIGMELLSFAGVFMLLIGSLVGGLIALGLFTVTAFSLPMLLDRPVDFATAIITSIAAVRANGMVMLRWAAIIAGLLIVAMLPLFLGLVVVLPLLGHATWHLYRRAVAPARRPNRLNPSNDGPAMPGRLFALPGRGNRIRSPASAIEGAIAKNRPGVAFSRNADMAGKKNLFHR